jgi:putative hemolysin
LGLWLEVLLIIVLVLANGVFSMSETAIVSSRSARLQQRADDGDAGAKIAHDLTRHPNIFLATVQIGITLIGVLSGAFGGATAARTLAGLIARFPPLAPYSSQIALALVVLVITYLSLIIGELVPKRLALNNPEGIAARVAGPMSTIARFGSPVVRLMSASTDVVLRLIRVRHRDEPPVTAEEIGVLLEQGARAGVFHPSEQEMVEAVFDLANDPVAAIMTPRTNVVWLDLTDTESEHRRQLHDTNHTRFPVCHGDLDNVAGVVHTKDLLNPLLNGGRLDIEGAARPALFVPESVSALQLLEQFRREHDQIALVVDEFGGIAGLVSLQDVLEAIVGDIPVPGAPQHPLIAARPDGSWLLDGTLPFDEAAELLDLDEDAGTRGGFHTLAGFVLTELGHIPATGERFTAENWQFEVVDMDGNRVDKVLAARPSASQPGESSV